MNPTTDGDHSPEPFLELDKEYLDNLNILLKKLRRYRWIYYQSADYYSSLYNKTYFPNIVMTCIITILSLFKANDETQTSTEVISYIISVLGVIIGVLSTIQSKFQFETKVSKFGYAGMQYNRLINKVSMEIKFPNESPQKFIGDIETSINSINDDLEYRPPLHLVFKYNGLHSGAMDDTSSEDGNGLKKCYDIDIEYDINNLNKKRNQKNIQHSTINMIE